MTHYLNLLPIFPFVYFKSIFLKIFSFYCKDATKFSFKTMKKRDLIISKGGLWLSNSRISASINKKGKKR
jgi:hypothetical protein